MVRSVILALGIAAAAMVVSIVALAGSGFAVWYARQEAMAVRANNLPTIVGELAGEGVNQSAGACVVKIVFVGKQQIDTAEISIRPGSGLDHIAQPGSTSAPALRSIRLDEITSGTPIEFAGLATDFGTGKVRVVMKGKGLGKMAVNVDLTNHTMGIY